MNLTELAKSYVFTKRCAGGGGGTGSGIIEVDSPPTENITKNTKYQVTGYIDVAVYAVAAGYNYTNLTDILLAANPVATIAYYVVDEFPANPLLSDIVTYTAFNVYIKNDIPKVYADVGTGGMWLDISALLTEVYASQGLELQFLNRGYIDNIDNNTETSAGVYVTYKDRPTAMLVDTDLVYCNGEWVTRKGLLLGAPLVLKEIKREDFFALKAITPYMFCPLYTCTENNGTTELHTSMKSYLEKVTIAENIIAIGEYAFDHNEKLEVVVIENANLTYIGERAFGYCTYLNEIHFNGTKEQWKNIPKHTGALAWDSGTPDYTIYCTDGTITKYGTET